MWDQIFYFFKFGQFWWKCHLAYKLKGQGHHVVCGSLCSKLWCWVWRPSAKCTCTHTQTHFICTHCTPKVTPQDKSFTNPLTGRWGNQLTSQPGSVSCSLGVLNGRAPCLMGTGQPRRKLLWQRRGGVILVATIERKRNKDRRRWLICATLFVQYNCVPCRVGTGCVRGGGRNVYSRCTLITS